MLRSTTFFLGGGVVIALGLALGAGLWWAGAGVAYATAWLAAGIAVGLGSFFVAVGRQARAYRRRWLREVEAGREPPPGGPPG
ncbi:MAG TPA: hypothetical protein VMH49_05340 [Thermoplasmata archaeon]|nr:hypothetical protein [Thermoplasmata archaeon]